MATGYRYIDVIRSPKVTRISQPAGEWRQDRWNRDRAATAYGILSDGISIFKHLSAVGWEL